MEKLFAKLSCLLTLSTILSGCAFTTDKIALNYNARGARDKVADAETVQIQVTANDNRVTRDKVGKKINGYGHEMGGIASTNDVIELVRGAIETELSLRGFPKGDSVLVSCDVNQFWNHFKMGFFAGDSIAEINLAVQVRNHEGNVFYSKEMAAQGLEPNIQIAAGHNAKAALEQGLSKAIEDLFQDPAFIPSLLKASKDHSIPSQPVLTAAQLIKDPKVREICAVLRSTDPEEIIHALKLLRKPECSDAVPAILPLLRHPHPNVVRDACRTLAVIANKDAIPSIEPLLKDKRSDVRKDAQAAIDKLRTKP